MEKALRALVKLALIVSVVGLLVAGAGWLSRAQAKARQSTAYGRLNQMRLALQMYEEDNGTLPPLQLRDSDGSSKQSWRALISPHIGRGFTNQLEQLDLSQPWNSDHNRGIIDRVSPDRWACFALDGSQMTSPVTTKLLAYVGRESIWNTGTGLPKGKMSENPDAILLIWIPQGKFHPLQPGDITAEEIRERVEKGEEVLFIAAGDGHRYGLVTIEGGELAFPTWQQELDRREGRH